MLNLLPRQIQHPARDDRRHERGERGVVPAALPDSRERRLAQAHLELVPQHDPHDQLPTVLVRTLCARHGCRDDVRRVGRILLPVDVVVVHHPDHQRVGQGGGDDVHSTARADHGPGTVTRYLVEHFERDLGVLLLEAAERAAQRVQQVAPRFANGAVRDVFEPQVGGPAGHLRRDRFGRLAGSAVRHGHLPPAIGGQAPRLRNGR